MSHNGPIHDIQLIPNTLPVGLNLMAVPELVNELSADDNLTKFVTCSSDRTIRFWHYIDPVATEPQRQIEIQKILARNAYCKDMSKMVFVQENELKDSDAENGERKPFQHFLAPPLDRKEDGSLIKETEKKIFRKDLTHAIRCIRIAPDGSTLACADFYGNIRIYDLVSKPNEIEEIKMIEAHDSEVICLAFSPQIESKNRFWLASGSRDKTILILDTKNDYAPVCTLNYHQSTVTSLQFSQTENNKISLISCSADKTIVQKRIDLRKV